MKLKMTEFDEVYSEEYAEGTHVCIFTVFTIKVPSTGVDRAEQTVPTQIRLLIKDLCCLSFHLHL